MIAVGSWIIGARSFFGNPFDGRTLISSVCQVESLTGEEVRDVCVDKGYRGKKNHPEGKKVYVSGGKRKGLSVSVRRFFKEEVINRACDRSYEAGVQNGSELSWWDRRR